MSEISSSKSELKKLYKSVPFTQYDVGWVILCIGMAIGSGIVF
ncbi:putative membrane protein, partial [Yersinia pestis PY-14]